MGEVIEMASFTKALAPAACSGLADHAQDRDAITIDLTDQFVCLVRRMMDSGFSLNDVVVFLQEQAGLLHQISVQLAEHGSGG
jgi:hypothetical protein